MTRSLPAAALAAFVACAVLACNDEPSKPSPTVGSVSGTITELDSSAPVADAAVVMVDPASLATRSALAATDGSGRYQIGGLAPGRYSVFVYHDSLVVFDRRSPYVQIEAGRTATYDMRLLSSELWSKVVRIAGVVRDAVSGAPIPGAYVGDAFWGISIGTDVWAPLVGITVPEWAVTDAAGRFDVDSSLLTDENGEPFGLAPISASKSGYEPNTLVGEGPPFYDLPPPLPMPSEDDSILRVEIRLQPLPGSPQTHGAIAGRTVFLDSAVSNVRVAVSLGWTSDPDTIRGGRAPAVPVPDRVAVTDDAGSFVVSGLVPGVYSIAAAYLPDDGYVGYNFRSDEGSMITVSAGHTTDVGDLHLLQALRPLSPADGASITDQTPVLAWTPIVPGQGYTLTHYEIGFADGYIQDEAGMSGVPSWQFPDSLAVARGGHGRWWVDAFATVPGGADTIVVATFERAATFTVQ